MEKEQKKTTYIIGLVLIGLVIIGGVIFMGSEEESATTLSSGSGENTETESVLKQDALLTISRVESLKLNSDIFNDPAFIELTNISVPINRGSVGRDNPFSSIIR